MTESNDIPPDWDALSDRGAEPAVEDVSAPVVEENDSDQPPLITLMAASWADLVGILAVCTAALLAILLMGVRPALPAFGWAAGLAFIWWIFAAGALVVVRNGTPGMLLAGLRFEEPIAPDRVPWVLIAALVGVLTAGLTGLLGNDGSLLRRAGGSDLSLVEEVS